MQEAPVKGLLVGVDIGEEADFEHSMEELASLAEAAEKEVVGQIVQRLDHVNKALYIGTGKVSLAVSRITGIPGVFSLISRSSSSPLPSGRLISNRIRDTPPQSSCSFAAFRSWQEMICRASAFSALHKP